MAIEQSTEAPGATAGIEPFSWLTDDARRYPGAEFTTRAYDMAAGIARVLQLVERSEMDRRDAIPESPPALTVGDSGTLLRFAIAAAQALATQARDRMAWMDENGAAHVRAGSVPILPEGAR